jgi:aryl-alcohol dehydrogenase-like predicted oxidoreductase
VSAPILGVTKSGQLEELVGALAVKLEPAELESLGNAYQPQEAVAELSRARRR